jgi:hypothetical protein
MPTPIYMHDCIMQIKPTEFLMQKKMNNLFFILDTNVGCDMLSDGCI